MPGGVEVPNTDVVPDHMVDALSSMLRVDRDRVRTSRRRPLEAGTVPKDVLTIHTDQGVEVVFCKHGSIGLADDRSRRRGVSFEEQVYRHFLEDLGAGTAALRGSYRRGDGGVTLVLDEVRDAVRLSEAPRKAIVEAAAWLGRFHSLAGVPSTVVVDLFVHDADQLRCWVSRVVEFAAPLRGDYPWLESLCEQIIDAAQEVMSEPCCLLHGEYTVHNVLVGPGGICPVDWESAGIGPGEIDLAMLTENWPATTIARCAEAYDQARFGGVRSRQERGLAVARGQLYATLRWLGDSPKLAQRSTTRWRYEHLKRHAATCGIG